MTLSNRPKEGCTRWQAQAACAGMDPALFYPGQGDLISPEVRAACERCPVQRQCLEYASMGPPEAGWWGGYGERQRMKLRTRISS